VLGPERGPRPALPICKQLPVAATPPPQDTYELDTHWFLDGLDASHPGGIVEQSLTVLDCYAAASVDDQGNGDEWPLSVDDKGEAD